jgi:hypothetical protein
MVFENGVESELWNLQIAQSFSKEFIIEHHTTWFEFNPIDKNIFLYILMNFAIKHQNIL